MAGVYVKLDVNYDDDPAIIDAGEKAELLFVRGLALAKRTLSDGFIADNQLPRFGLSGVKTRAERLRSVGLWVRDDDRGGYWIAGWAKWNRSKAEVAEIREKRQKAGSKGGKASGQARRQANAKQSASPNGKQPSNPETETETETETEVKTLASAPPPRPRDLLFEALVDVCGLSLSELTKSARGRVNVAAKELRDIGATPDGVRARAKVHRTRWPNAELTPTSLATNYAQLGSNGNGTAHVATCRDCGQAMHAHDDDTCETVKAVRH